MTAIKKRGQTYTYRDEIINGIIRKWGYTNYLEVGTSTGWNYKRIVCDNKVGVDPDPEAFCDIHTTSDEFFKTNKQKFGAVFIDGMHEAGQFFKDVENSLNCLEDGGTIICHDCNPTSYEMQVMPRMQTQWTGDVWKGWLKLRATRDDLQMFVIETDYGVGIIRRGKQKLIPYFSGNYWDFDKIRTKALPLITPNEFKVWLQYKT